MKPEQYCPVAAADVRAAEQQARWAEEQRQMQQITQAVARGVMIGNRYNQRYYW